MGRGRARAACWALLAVGVAGCPHRAANDAGSSSPEAALVGAASPAALLEAVQVQSQAKDHAGFFGVLTPATRQQVLGAAVVGASLATLGKDLAPDPVRESELQALLAAHGVEPRPTAPAGAPDSGAPASGGLASQLDRVEDPAALYGGLLGFIERNTADAGAAKVTATRDLAVHGDRGTAALVMTTEGGEEDVQAVELHLLEGRWYLHFPEQRGAGQ